MNFNTDNLSDNYETPKWLFNALNEIFHFTHDLAGDKTNNLIAGSPLFGDDFDALEVSWKDYPMSFIHPPYSKPNFQRFLKKAYTEYSHGNSSVLMVPLKTIATDYFKTCRPPLIACVFPKVQFYFNGQENYKAETIALLCYVRKSTVSYEKNNLPTMRFLDLEKAVPQRKREY